MITPLRKLEWESIACLVAAVAAIILHFLHFTHGNVLRVITLMLVGLLFLRDIRSEERWGLVGERIQALRPAARRDPGNQPPRRDLLNGLDFLHQGI